MKSELMARHAKAFGDAHSKALSLDMLVYNEAQCRECPHDHCCCEYVVACGPFEALGIIHYLIATQGPEGARSMLSLVKMRADDTQKFLSGYVDEKGEMSEESHGKMAADWYGKGLKCIFYNGKEKTCSIYEVRPIACRRTFGDGDCKTTVGAHSAGTHEYAEIRRLTRIKITQGPPLEQHREMTTLITYLSKGAAIGMAKSEQALLDKEPMLLSDDDHLWGPDGPPVQLNPVL